MSYLPYPHLPQTPTITTFSENSIGRNFAELANINTINNAVTSSTANRAVFIPFTIEEPIVIKNLFAANGTVVAGNIDVGLYNSDGTRIVSIGSTVQAGTSALQVFSITPLTIGPGLYYLAYANNNVSASWYGVVGTNGLEPLMTGVLMQLSGFPLPANATFVNFNSSFITLIGLSTVPTV